MRVLLLAPLYVPGFMRNARWDALTVSGSNWYPIWLAYCTGLLEREKHEAKLVDAQVKNLTHEETYRMAEEFAPELTVLYYSNMSLQNDLMIGERIKELTGCDVVLVGYSASINSVETLEQSSSIDLMARGEFDFTVLDLANKVPKEQIKGLLWKDSRGAVHENPPRPPVPAEELDGLPFVTDVYRRHLNLWDYHLGGHKHPYVDMFTGRGCAWGLCTFCVWPHIFYKGGGYRTRSIANVIEELKFIRDEMPYVKDVYFQDDVLPKDRVRELSQAILDNNIKLRWSGYARANLDLDTLKLMKRAGCCLLEVGLESSSQQILKNIKKGTTIKQVEEFAKNARKAGVFIIGAIITGLPGETVATIKATTAWANKLPIKRFTITLPKAYPGTPLYEYLAENGYLKNGRPHYPNLSSEEIYYWNKWSLRHVYLTPSFFFKTITAPSQWLWVLRSAKYLLPYIFSRRAKNIEGLEW